MSANPPRAPGELAEIEAIIRRNIVLQHMGPDSFMEGFEEAAAEIASLRSATGDGGEAKGCDLDTAMKRGIRAWSARLHVPVTRMMSRVLREEIHAALQPRSTKIEEADDNA